MDRCDNDHELTDDNVLTMPTGFPQCRKCMEGVADRVRDKPDPLMKRWLCANGLHAWAGEHTCAECHREKERARYRRTVAAAGRKVRPRGRSK